MRKILTVVSVILASCSAIETKKPAPQDAFVSEIQKFAHGVGTLSKPTTQAKAVVAIDSAQPSEKIIGISTTTPGQYLGWVKTSVGFSKGEITESALQTLGLDLPYSWRVLKRWDDNTVRLAQFKTVAFLTNYGVNAVALTPGKTPSPFFSWHPETAKAVAGNWFGNNLKITATANGVAVECTPASGAYKFSVVDNTEITVRFRSHCARVDNHASVPLSMTAWFTLMSLDPTIRISLALGNDTREFPVPGGILVQNVAVQTGNLPTVHWVQESLYGNKSTNLGDGQTMAWKMVSTLDPAFASTALVLKTGEPMGFQLWQDMVTSKAFGTAPIPQTRIPLNQVGNVHTQVNAQAGIGAQSSPNTHLGLINKCPPNTGDQPAFSSTMNAENQKAAQSYSARKMAFNTMAIYRESFRPAFLWETRNGVEDRISVLSYPNLFCWSGHCPHYDYSWNNSYPEFFSRTSNAGFNGGDTSGWCPHDHEHVALQPIRDVYELGADPFVEDVLRHYVNMFDVGYFSPRWTAGLEAERAFGRTLKDAVALTELFPEMPETAILRNRIEAKKQAYSNATTQTVIRFTNPAAVPFNALDPRVNGGQWGPAQVAYGQGNFVAVGWQSGFANEAQSLWANPDMRLLAAVQTYFLNDGTPKTYFQLPFPGVYTTGGIGEHWSLSGYVSLAAKNPGAPGADFALNVLKPRLNSLIESAVSGYFSPLDGWKNF